MSATAELSADRRTLTVTVPLVIRKRGGRKKVIAPDVDQPCELSRSRPDTALVKALSRAFRWRRMLERGDYATIVELAAAEKINQSYICRVLRLTLLAPSIIEAILYGREPEQLTMARLFMPFPLCWVEQGKMLCTVRGGPRSMASQSVRQPRS